MRIDFEPAHDLGLQHVLKNGVAILRGENLAEERRSQVLDGLLHIVSDADRGSEALKEQSLTFALDERPAVERFSLFLRYLGNSVEEVEARLSEAKAVLADMGAGLNVSAQRRTSVANLLIELIEGLARERAFAPLTAPREFDYN